MMQKKFTTFNQQWDLREESYRYPPNCLSCTIKNDGDSLILIDEAVELKPGRAYSIPAILGYYLTGFARIKVLKTSAPYANHTKVTFRNAVEVTD